MEGVMALSDFDLFVSVKRFLAGQEFPDGEALVPVINAILSGIEKVTSERVFLEWMERLRRRIETGGESVNQTISSCQENCIISGQSRDAHG
jgi:hypothetical protein